MNGVLCFWPHPENPNELVQAYGARIQKLLNFSYQSFPQVFG